ncbi:MAG TPA: arginine--tRNA ligase [Candidatus Saccharibacteria bacterium]|nr:arginine--tRNA ligase [Candidatus Saccharibacteria bacterium]
MKKVFFVIKDVIKQSFNVDLDFKLSRPDPQFGDFSLNVAMQLAKKIGKNPREIAEILSEKLRQCDLFSEISVDGPGFINLRLNDCVLTDELHKILINPADYGKSEIYANKIIVTEYSDPNPFKVLHVGHLYTSIIGDAISNLVENAGGNVHRVNFGGDVGLHVGKTMWAITKKLGGEYPEKLNDITENNRSEWIGSCYVEGSRAYENDENIKNEIILINKAVYRIHSENDHDSQLAKIYWTCRQWSYDYFEEFYSRIGTKFEKYYPESETAQIGLNTVLEQKEKGVYKESNGAIIFEGEPFGLHSRVFINNEGLPTYEAKDVGLSIKKWDDYHFDESIIITGNDIVEYMKVVQKSIEQFRPDLSEKTKHITHGNVKLSGGIKMSSRKGNFLRALDVINMTAEENEKAQGNRDNEPIMGAIKYAFLKNRIGADIVFEPKDSVNLHGNSGPYLQYALVRAKSINRKLSIDDNELVQPDNGYSKYERDLIYKMSEYPEIIEKATIEFLPHQLCSYLYELAQEFNRFYENSRVIGDERESIRLKLVLAYSLILENGIKILGIPTPEKM